MENKNQIKPSDDLAGYQHVLVGAIQPGDILVEKITRTKHWANYWYFGVDVLANEHVFDVYREMECPKHEGQTMFSKRETLEQAEERVFKKIVKDASIRAKTNDHGKPPLANLPWKGLREVSFVQAFGHDKYGDFHNYKAGMEVSRIMSCALRHISEYMDGNDNDPESGKSHLAHAACRLLFALENIADGKAIDDRYKSDEKTAK